MVNRVNLELRLKIYQLLIEQFFNPGNVVKILESTTSRSNIYYHVKELERERAIVKICESPAQYRKGINSLKYDNLLAKKYNMGDAPGLSQFGTNEVCRVHNHNFHCDVIELPDSEEFNNIRWSRQWGGEETGGVRFYEMDVITSEGTEGTFRLIVGKKVISALVRIPPISTRELRGIEEKVLECAEMVRKTIVRVLRISTERELRPVSSVHYGFKDPLLDNLDLKGVLTGDYTDVWSDSSPGSREVETTRKDIALVRLNMPGQILELRDRQTEVEDSTLTAINRVNNRLAGVEHKLNELPEITRALEGITKILERLIPEEREKLLPPDFDGKGYG